MIVEILQVIFGTIWAFFSGIITALWESLPVILEVRKVANIFTPIKMVALWLGVPSFLIFIIIFLIKKLVVHNYGGKYGKKKI